MSDYRIALCTCADREKAQTIASTLVEKRLAACVNIIDNVTSVYLWQDKVETDQECQLVIKTTVDHIQSAWETVKSIHGYDVPEWLVIDQVSGSEEYLSWITSSLK